MRIICDYEYENDSCKDCPAEQNKSKGKLGYTLICDCIEPLKKIIKDFPTNTVFFEKGCERTKNIAITIKEEYDIRIWSPSVIALKTDFGNSYHLHDNYNGFAQIIYKA